MSKENKQSFMQGIMTLIFSQIIIKILGLIYKLYLTNKEGFGDVGNAIYNSGFQIYALILTITSIGVPNALAKLISEKLSLGDKQGVEKIFKVALAFFSVIGFIGSMLLFFGSEFIANNLLQIKEAKLTLMILAPAIFFESLIAVYRGYFNGYENMKPMAKSQTIEQFIKTTFTIIIVEMLCGFLNNKENIEKMAAGANLANTIATFTSFMYLTYLYKKKKKSDFKDKRYEANQKNKNLSIKQIVKSIIVIAMPLTISAILGTLNKNIDSLTVVRGLKTFMSEEKAKIEYGILSGKIDTLVTFPLSFNIAFSTALIPAISADKAKRNYKNIEKRILFSILVTILIGLSCSVGMFIFAKPILEMLFPNASSGEFLYKISSLSIIFITLEQTINGALQGLGKIDIPVKALSVGVLVKLILNLILVRINPDTFIFGGAAGAALATVICHIISMTISFISLKKNINIKLNVSKFIIKPIIANLFMGISSLCIYNYLSSIIIPNVAIIVTIVFAAIAYIISLMVIKIFEKDELYMLPFYSNFSKKTKTLREKTL